MVLAHLWGSLHSDVVCRTTTEALVQSVAATSGQQPTQGSFGPKRLWGSHFCSGGRLAEDEGARRRKAQEAELARALTALTANAGDQTLLPRKEQRATTALATAAAAAAALLNSLRNTRDVTKNIYRTFPDLLRQVGVEAKVIDIFRPGSAVGIRERSEPTFWFRRQIEIFCWVALGLASC